MSDSQKRKTRINVEVTEKDIERARRNDSYRCVVAQAIARALPEATNIEVDSQSTRYTLGGVRYCYFTPYAVQGYVIGFDAGDEIHPFSFQLRDPKIIRRKRLTEAGKAIERARGREFRSKAKPPPATAEAGTGKPPVGTSKKVPTGAAKPKSELEEVKAAYSGAKKSTSTGEPGSRRAPPRVFKKKKRMYGHRLLRINQEVLGPAEGGAASSEEE
jgi:hypothetical protein